MDFLRRVPERRHGRVDAIVTRALAGIRQSLIRKRRGRSAGRVRQLPKMLQDGVHHQAGFTLSQQKITERLPHQVLPAQPKIDCSRMQLLAQIGDCIRRGDRLGSFHQKLAVFLPDRDQQWRQELAAIVEKGHVNEHQHTLDVIVFANFGGPAGHAIPDPGWAQAACSRCLSAIIFQSRSDSASKKRYPPTRSSLARQYRLTPLTVRMNTMKQLAMMMPSGRSLILVKVV